MKNWKKTKKQKNLSKFQRSNSYHDGCSLNYKIGKKKEEKNLAKNVESGCYSRWIKEQIKFTYHEIIVFLDESSFSS